MVQQKQLLDAARVTMGMLTSYYVLALLVILLLAAALLLEQKASQPERVSPGIYPPCDLDRLSGAVGAVVLIVVYTNLRLIHADMAYKQADPYDGRGCGIFRSSWTRRRSGWRRQRIFTILFLGRAFLEKAKTSPVADRPGRSFTLAEVLRLSPQRMAELSREDFFWLSETVLLRALEINPYEHRSLGQPGTALSHARRAGVRPGRAGRPI